MNVDLYPKIFKRKSFHLFEELKGKTTDQEIKELEGFIKSLDHLYPDIKVRIDIEPSSFNGRGRGEEYVIVFYSEEKDNYLTNIGYIGEQIDLFLVSRNIGTLWYGLGIPQKRTMDGLPYVIMILFGKKDGCDFRKDMYSSSRKELTEIWEGQQYPFSNIIRYAPSACNTQNWYVESKSHELDVYRQQYIKRGIMPANKVTYYNRIDMGIFLLFLELNLKHESISFRRELFIDNGENEKTLIAKYRI
jgi:hypothetical protein